MIKLLTPKLEVSFVVLMHDTITFRLDSVLDCVCMYVCVVMTWYPEIDGTTLPWSIAYTPTVRVAHKNQDCCDHDRDDDDDDDVMCVRVCVCSQEPLLSPTRRVIPKVNGVDVSPIVWTALLSFANETLLGPQGVLVILAKKAAAAE